MRWFWGGTKGWYVRTAPSLLREDKCRLNGRSDGILLLI
ncbi:hypothetical protein NM36_2088 [Neisseria meningitidis NM36]|nr:hypothetical protein NM36_2088 [Neisseria meningitidis NM36]